MAFPAFLFQPRTQQVHILVLGAREEFPESFGM